MAPGEAIARKGYRYCLPASHIVHTVEPQLHCGSKPKSAETRQPARCYLSFLDATEPLSDMPDGRKIVAFCGIFTGLFAYPPQDAPAAAAADAVADWLEHNKDTSITEIIVNTFTGAHHVIYQEALASAPRAWMRPAGHWLRSGDTVIISAGAGSSASDELDYTSSVVFAKHFLGFLEYGLRTLYSGLGFDVWPTEQVVAKVQGVPLATLIAWAEKSGVGEHVRTSNADGLFVANGLPPDKLLVSHCLANCRPKVTVFSAPLFEDA
ncbi:hypothetical protein LZ30DRAFT_800428 [Colletotrichum cereale]|nr:hypothetical protein LZ30DRAFT_800428 [Colletotrichum cereale]